MNSIEFSVFDPAGCQFPDPRIPYLPRLDAPMFRAAPKAGFEFVGFRRTKRSYTRGRYALFDAYRLAGVGPQGSLLAPAYHCRTMLDAAVRLDGDINLYQLHANLAPDLASIHRAVARAASPVRALLVTHYFGFVQELAAIKSYCVEQGITLIEDCSHALFNSCAQPRLGTLGDYTIASPYKLFPCEEGGWLIPGPTVAMPPAPGRSPGLKAELRTLYNATHRSRTHPQPALLEQDRRSLDQRIAAFDPPAFARGQEHVQTARTVSKMYDPREEGLAGTHSARWLMRLVNLQQVTHQRRANYQAWADYAATLPHCRALFPALPDDVVPYMFPLYIEHPDPHFYALKQLGMPIWRWDEMALSDCTLSRRYRFHLLHLPCHQSLTPADLQWMMDAVGKVMRGVRVAQADTTRPADITATALAGTGPTSTPDPRATTRDAI